MRSAFPLLAALALSGCATPPINEGPIPRDGEMVRLGQAARAGPLVVTPRAVIEDSRCPANVQCVWAGRIVVRTDVSAGMARDVLDLELGRPTPVGGGELMMTSAEPGKFAGTATDPRAYRFIFRFDGQR